MTLGQCIARLIAAGIPPEEAGAIAAEIYALGASSVSDRNSNAERQQRYRDRKRNERNETVTERNAGDVTTTVTERNETVTSNATAVSPIDTKIKKGKRQNSEGALRGTRIASDWLPGPDGHAFALAEGLSVYEIGREAARFRDYWGSRAGAGGVKTNWMLTWQNWIRTTAEKLGKTPRPSGPEGLVTGFYAKFGSEEQDAWDRYGQETRKKAFPRDKSGGWNFPTQWPPGYKPQPKLDAPPTPAFRTMQ